MHNLHFSRSDRENKQPVSIDSTPLEAALRAAIRGVWANERAPRELRKQIIALCPTQAIGQNSEPLILRIRSVLYGLAAAAVFLLAIGLVFGSWTGGGRRPQRAPRMI